jgi:hypothetical protein
MLSNGYIDKIVSDCIILRILPHVNCHSEKKIFVISLSCQNWAGMELLIDLKPAESLNVCFCISSLDYGEKRDIRLVASIKNIIFNS